MLKTTNCLSLSQGPGHGLAPPPAPPSLNSASSPSLHMWHPVQQSQQTQSQQPFLGTPEKFISRTIWQSAQDGQQHTTIPSLHIEPCATTGNISKGR